MKKLIKIKIFKNIGVPVDDSDMLDAAINPDGILRAVEHKFFYRTREGDIITRTGARLSLRTEAADCQDDFFTTATVQQLTQGTVEAAAGGELDLEELYDETESESENDPENSEHGHNHDGETGTPPGNNVPCPAQGVETYIIPEFVIEARGTLHGSGGLAQGVLLVFRKKREKEKDLSKI